MDDFTYSLGRVSDAALADLAADFDTLAPSDYADGAYRLRRYSTFTFDRAHCTVELLPPHDFVQGDDINRFQGNVERHYDDLLPSTYSSAGFAELCEAFAAAAHLPERARIEVHQMRVLARAEGDTVEAAPEGVHQDGFDRIAIATIGRADSTGADLSLHESQDAAPLVTLRQEPGQYCVLNDRALWHSANALTAVVPGHPGTWDCLVLTANQE